MECSFSTESYEMCLKDYLWKYCSLVFKILQVFHSYLFEVWPLTWRVFDTQQWCQGCPWSCDDILQAWPHTKRYQMDIPVKGKLPPCVTPHLEKNIEYKKISKKEAKLLLNNSIFENVNLLSLTNSLARSLERSISAASEETSKWRLLVISNKRTASL